MQIACKKFGCQKAVEVCYWACKHRRNCKDWRGAVEGEPGQGAIQSRLEAAAAKSGRLFDARTLVSPGKPKRIVTAPSVSLLTAPAVEAKFPASEKTRCPTARPAEVRADEAQAVVTRTAGKPRPKIKSAPKETAKKMAKPLNEDTLPPAPAATDGPAESNETSPKPKKKAAAKPKQATTGPVYLLLSANGKYRELRESELLTEAAAILRDPSLRLVKGQFLVPQISFKPADE